MITPKPSKRPFPKSGSVRTIKPKRVTKSTIPGGFKPPGKKGK